MDKYIKKIKEIEELDKIYAEQIKVTCFSNDTERDHVKADDIIIELLERIEMTRTAENYKLVNKWYA